MNDKIVFFKNFIKNPRQIGSIIPSSEKLSKKMVEQIDFENANFIVKLGPGVGCFTKKILNNKSKSTKYIAFEKNSDMRSIIRKKFEDIELYENERNY